ncbi:MAG: acyltransferase family protein [Paracoccaceae bacterium]
MTRGVSLWLDALRVVATLIVVLSHLAYPRFTGTSYSYLRDWNVGSDAVIVFFVMSGCVIAYAADRDGNPGRFAFNRLTRLLTVMVPALLLTFAFDAIGNQIDQSAYPEGFYHSLPLGEFLLRGLSFSNEWDIWGRVRLGTNGPLWSLSYEAAYYVLFGVAIFMQGPTRVAVLLAVALLAGIDILLLMPAWLMGVGLWHWIKSGGANRHDRAFGWCLALGGPIAYLLFKVSGVPEALSVATATTLGVPDARFVLGFSDEFLWNFLIGVFTTAHVAGIAILNPQRFPAGQVVRWLAGASFSIYVTHYPVLHLLDASLPEMIGRDVLLLSGSIFVGIVFANYFERPVKRIRQWILTLQSRWLGSYSDRTI